MQAVQFPRWFVVLGHADDMPVVGNNRCLELDSVVLQSFRSCSSLMVGDISVGAGAGSYGPTVQCTTWPASWLYISCRSHRCRLCFVGVSPVPVAGPFLVLQYIFEYIIWFRVFFAQHRDSRCFGLVCRYCHMLMVCFKSSFLWSSIIAGMIFAVVGFFFSAKDSKVSAIMVSLVVSGWCSGRFGL